MTPIPEDENFVKPCPICKKPSDKQCRPFCSKRCADVDLNKWLTGRYAVPVPDDEAEEVPNDSHEEN